MCASAHRLAQLAGTFARVRDLCERVLDDGGVSSNYIIEAAHDVEIILIDAADLPYEHRTKLRFVAAALRGEPWGCCDWQRRARVCHAAIVGYDAWDATKYDPKAEGARKLAEIYA